MADTHYEVDEGLKKGRDLMDRVRVLTQNLAALDDMFASMAKMKDGDGSSASHFQKVVDLFGVQGDDVNDKLANAKTIHDELNSTCGNSAALRQFLAIMG